jgi:hypothetical protein
VLEHYLNILEKILVEMELKIKSKIHLEQVSAYELL